jgi:hypothetical protein
MSKLTLQTKLASLLHVIVWSDPKVVGVRIGIKAMRCWMCCRKKTNVAGEEKMGSGLACQELPDHVLAQDGLVWYLNCHQGSDGHEAGACSSEATQACGSKTETEAEATADVSVIILLSRSVFAAN